MSSQLIHLVETKKVLPREFLKVSAYINREPYTEERNHPMIQYSQVASDLRVVADSLDNQRGGVRWNPESRGLLPVEGTHVALTSNEMKNEYRILAVLGRTIYLRPTPALPSGTLHSKFTKNAQKDQTAVLEVEEEFLAASVAIVDDLLSKTALFELRSFCEDSTIFHKNYIQVSYGHIQRVGHLTVASFDFVYLLLNLYFRATWELSWGMVLDQPVFFTRLLRS